MGILRAQGGLKRTFNSLAGGPYDLLLITFSFVLDDSPSVQPQPDRAQRRFFSIEAIFVNLKVTPILRTFVESCLLMESSETANGVVIDESAGATKGEESSPEQQTTSPAADVIAERDRLAREKAELQDLLQRRQAEFENFRRRSERERSETFEFASMDAVKSLLPALDDFERALKVESADKEYARGMEMIYQRVFEALKKLGLEPIVNDVPVFNPHIHHAVEMVDTKDHADQTILDEYQRGYYFKGKLLRPAMVSVAVNP
jgi:molecular chaperone GrpE